LASPARVLVIDDEPAECAGIGRALSQHGFEVETALEVKVALDKVQSQRFDVLLIDLMMPGMNGLDLLARLRHELPEARALVITGLGAKSHAIEGFRLGAFDFIVTPFSRDELLSATLRAANAHGEARALAPPAAPGFYHLGAHSWVQQVDRNLVVLGAHDSFQRTAGKFVSVDLPNQGDHVVQGEICARIRVEAGGIYTLWSPASGRVIEANLGLLDHPALANSDPYGKGWFVRLFPDAFDEERLLLSHRPT
jgi:CheY-like chemotaxis protein/glycine cleavage system H lipoate-binding protein